MGRYWFMGDLTRRARLQEQSKAALEAEMGIGEAELRQGQAVKKALHLDQLPGLNHGSNMEILVNGETYTVEGSDTNQGGDRTIYATRRVGGGRFQSIRVGEMKEGENTRVSAWTKGGR